jgi:hypothetical protein
MANTKLLTGSERDAYIAEHFKPGTIVPDELMIEQPNATVQPTLKAQEDFATWYDSKSEEYQLLIDEISDRTHYIIDEDEYDSFIEELANYGINDAEQFEDAFEREVEGYGERVFAEFSEELYESMAYETVPAFLVGCIDWELVWRSALRYDYQTVEFKGNTYFFRNI